MHPPKKKRRWNPKHGRNVNFGIFFGRCVWFCLFGFPCFFLVFWLVPFILLHVLVSFQRFLPLIYGFFLSIRCAFCSIDFTCFFNIMFVSLDFAVFCKLEILQSLPSIGYLLLSFRYISYRFYADLMFSFHLRHFGFTLLLGRRPKAHQARERHITAWPRCFRERHING